MTLLGRRVTAGGITVCSNTEHLVSTHSVIKLFIVVLNPSHYIIIKYMDLDFD